MSEANSVAASLGSTGGHLVYASVMAADSNTYAIHVYPGRRGDITVTVTQTHHVPRRPTTSSQVLSICTDGDGYLTALKDAGLMILALERAERDRTAERFANRDRSKDRH
jgi:hypothetical protein